MEIGLSGLIVAAVILAAVVSAVVARRRGASRNIDNGAVSSGWLAAVNSERDR